MIFIEFFAGTCGLAAAFAKRHVYVEVFDKAINSTNDWDTMDLDDLKNLITKYVQEARDNNVHIKDSCDIFLHFGQ